jgi:hypothetical protein
MTHCLVVDEFGRVNDVDAISFWSPYWNASVHFLSGDPNQLKPMTFGDAEDNPFQKQMQPSVLSCLVATGTHVFFLPYTARFASFELLKICALFNDIPDVAPVDGAYDSLKTKEYATIVQHIWSIKHPVLCVNSHNCIVDGIKIKYCMQTAQDTMKTLDEACAHLDGLRIAIITPYNAQKLLLDRMRAQAITKALAQGRKSLAQRLEKVDRLDD